MKTWEKPFIYLLLAFLIGACGKESKSGGEIGPNASFSVEKTIKGTLNSEDIKDNNGAYI